MRAVRHEKVANGDKAGPQLLICGSQSQEEHMRTPGTRYLSKGTDSVRRW